MQGVKMTDTKTRINEYVVMKKTTSQGATPIGTLATWADVQIVTSRAEGHKWIKENFETGCAYVVDIRGEELTPKIVPTRVVKF